MILLNPWVLLALAVVLAGSNFYSYNLGGDHKENEVKAHYAELQDKAIKEANDNALIDMQAAREVGARESRARVNTVYIKGKAELIFRDNPQPPLVCDWKPDAFSVLNDAIKAANDLAGATKPVPDAGSVTKPATKP